jgi:hypothetical protein
MVEWFQLIIFKDNYHKVFIFHKVIGHIQQMTRIAFGVTRSKVKITGAFSVRMVSAFYLEDFLLQSLHISHTGWS